MIGTIKELIPKMLQLDETKEYEIKEYKLQRNKKQNAKYWKLLYELAKKLNISVEELHFQMLKDFSKRTDIMVKHGIKLKGIKYLEKRSTIRREDGQLFDIYYYYTPSHELDISEFAFLMTGLIQECEQQGIDTVSPDEKRHWQELAKDLWSRGYGNTKKSKKRS